MSKVNIVAEISWCHMGDMDLAKKMIKSASENGADYVKTQVFDEKYLKPGPWDADGRREIYKKAQLSYEQLVEMKKYCEECGTKFLASTMSVRDARLYFKVTTGTIKIPSFESRNKKLIEFSFDNFDKVIMSTGTSTIDEIRNSLFGIGYKKLQKLVLMHCVSSYPCLPEDSNLIKIHRLHHLMFELGINKPEVGYSDHIIGIESVKVSLDYNIKWIEKHFTIDHSLPGRDNKFAILPHELKNLVDYIKLRELMLTPTGKENEYMDCEQETREIQTGRFAMDE